jgi:hypothetical protein
MLLAAPLAVPAVAQNVAADDPAALQTITVTGEKIARDLEDTTTSVGMLDADRIAAAAGVRG